MNAFKFLKIRTPEKFALIPLKFESWSYHRVMCPKDADGMANSLDFERCVNRKLGH